MERGNLAAADELYSNDFVCHFVIGPEWRGVEGIKNEVRQHRIAFPDWNERVDDIVAEGDKVVIRLPRQEPSEVNSRELRLPGKRSAFRKWRSFV